jgi:hypothetical protein
MHATNPILEFSNHFLNLSYALGSNVNSNIIYFGLEASLG